MNLSGTTYGRLMVIGLARLHAVDSGTKPRLYKYWQCRCECGRFVEVRTETLRSGKAKSCGCLRTEIHRKRLLRHGKTKTRIFNIWNGMIDRCRNPNNTVYQRYGGRGISVCDRWKKFENFFSDMGEPPSQAHSIDRINTNGDYEPDNCRWATAREQANNTRQNIRLRFNGKTLTVKQWSRERQMSYAALIQRVHLGWSVERILTEPVRKLSR